MYAAFTITDTQQVPIEVALCPLYIVFQWWKNMVYPVKKMSCVLFNVKFKLFLFLWETIESKMSNIECKSLPTYLSSRNFISYETPVSFGPSTVGILGLGFLFSSPCQLVGGPNRLLKDPQWKRFLRGHSLFPLEIHSCF